MVLVSHTHEFIFLKTRKTAGTTVEMCLEPVCSPPGTPIVEETETRFSKQGIVGARLVPEKTPRWLYKKTNLWRSHVGAKRVSMALGAEKFARYQKVSCIRNPFDRSVSLFHWREMAKEDFSETKLAFRDFILNQKWPDDNKITHVDGVYVVDRMIRFETLKEDIEAVAAELGVEVDPDALPHTKSTSATRKKIAVQDYYDKDTIEVVKSRFDWVFDRFPYSTKPGEPTG